MSDPTCQVREGEIAWTLLATILVLGMVPALGMFEAGLLRSKNTVSILTQVLAGLAFNSMLWYIVGYSFVFGDSLGGVIGNPADHPMFLGLENSECYPGTHIPEQAFAIFQMMFAAITPLLLTGAFAERLLWKHFVVFIVAWEVLVYYPVAHWVWGGGFLARLGTIDFAGGLTIHTTAGVAAIVSARRLHRRVDFDENNGHYPPSNVPLAVIGGTLLWMGWFGFNAGSTLGNMDLATTVVINTQIASSVSATVWLFMSWMHGAPNAVELLNGAIVGLATITPASGFVSSQSAFVIGLITAPISFGTLYVIRIKLRIDDALDVSSVHGMPGVVGLIATGFCASASVNSNVDNGIILGGDGKLLGYQLAGIGIVAVYTAIVTRLIFIVIRRVFGRMVREETEREGLDMADHSVTAYRHQETDRCERFPLDSFGRTHMTDPLLAGSNHQSDDSLYLQPR